MNQKYSLVELKKAAENSSKLKKFANLKVKNGKYFAGNKEIVPVELRDEFLKRFYDGPETGFYGRDRLYAGIARRDVMAFLANLETALIHTEPKNVKISRPVVLRKPMAGWAWDLTWLKKWTINREVVKSAGAPSTMRTDNGSEFISKEFQAVNSEYGIKHIFSDAYNPRQMRLLGTNLTSGSSNNIPQIAAQVIHILQNIHEHGLSHNDIKPDHIV